MTASRSGAHGQGARPIAEASIEERVAAVVETIPSGRVATYGMIAALAAIRGGPRRVGRALAQLPEERDVPWHRVVRADGTVAVRGGLGVETLQRRLLEAEGVVFSPAGRIDLRRFLWDA